MRLIYDTVSGHEIHRDGQLGRIMRTGIAVAEAGDLPDDNVPTKKSVTLVDEQLPAYGASYGVDGYLNFLLMKKTVRAITASTHAFVLEYRNVTEFYIQDQSVLQQVPSQLHPSGTPLTVVVNDALGAINRTVTMSYPLPMRNFSVRSVQNYGVSINLINCIGCVNGFSWQGLPAGFWLLTGFSGETPDLGITFIFQATWTTKQREDWSQYGFMRDGFGQTVPIPPAQIADLASQPYAYGINNTYDGIIKVGMYPMVDFLAIFGV